jgi:hypothetical protein
VFSEFGAGEAFRLKFRGGPGNCLPLPPQGVDTPRRLRTAQAPPS